MLIDELLFGKNKSLSKKSDSLFESQADIARSIMKVEGGGFKNKNEGSVRAFINQALRPDSDKNSRPISPNLRKALFAVIKERLHDEINVDIFLLQQLKRL